MASSPQEVLRAGSIEPGGIVLLGDSETCRLIRPRDVLAGMTCPPSAQRLLGPGRIHRELMSEMTAPQPVVDSEEEVAGGEDPPWDALEIGACSELCAARCSHLRAPPPQPRSPPSHPLEPPAPSPIPCPHLSVRVPRGELYRYEIRGSLPGRFEELLSSRDRGGQIRSASSLSISGGNEEGDEAECYPEGNAHVRSRRGDGIDRSHGTGQNTPC